MLTGVDRRISSMPPATAMIIFIILHPYLDVMIILTMMMVVRYLGNHLMMKSV